MSKQILVNEDSHRQKEGISSKGLDLCFHRVVKTERKGKAGKSVVDLGVLESSCRSVHATAKIPAYGSTNAT